MEMLKEGGSIKRELEYEPQSRAGTSLYLDALFRGESETRMMFHHALVERREVAALPFPASGHDQGVRQFRPSAHQAERPFQAPFILENEVVDRQQARDRFRDFTPPPLIHAGQHPIQLD